MSLPTKTKKPYLLQAGGQDNRSKDESKRCRKILKDKQHLKNNLLLIG